MKAYKLGLGCLVIAPLVSQTRVDLRTQAKSVDFSGASSTRPSQTGTLLPATCSVGQTFFKTDAPAGQNLYACTTVNVWTIEGVGGISSVFGRTGAVTPQSGDYSAAQITGLAPSATMDATNAANITIGTLGAARLPAPGAATLGGVQSKDCTAGGQFLQKINTDGTETCATPAAGGGGVADPGANGIVSRTALNTLTARTIVGGSGITIANGDGVAGAPLIGLDTTVAITQAQVQSLAPLTLQGTLTGNIYNGAMNPPPGGFLDANNNPLTVNFCPVTTWTGGAVSLNTGLGAKRVLIYGYDPPATAFVSGSCYLLAYNPTITVDGVAGMGAFELKSLSGLSSHLFLPNAGTTGTTLNKLTKLTGAPSAAVSTAAGDTGGVIGITVAGAGTTLTAVIQTNGVASCVFDGATTAGHYVQTSSGVAGDCHDSGAPYPTSGQVVGRVLATNGSAGINPIQLFGAEIQAATGSGGTISSVFGRTGAVTAQSGDYSASQITSGTLPAAQLPAPTTTTLGGVQAKDCAAGGQFLQKINPDGTAACGTPSGGNGPGEFHQLGVAGAVSINNGSATTLVDITVPPIPAGKCVGFQFEFLHNQGTGTTVYSLQYGSSTLQPFTSSSGTQWVETVNAWQLCNITAQSTQDWRGRAVMTGNSYSGIGVWPSFQTSSTDASQSQHLKIIGNASGAGNTFALQYWTDWSIGW